MPFMEVLKRHKWQVLALGGACAATAVLVIVAKRKKDSKANPKTAPKKAIGTPKTSGYIVGSASKGSAGSKSNKAASVNVTRESLASWLASLQKRDNDELPTLLEWTEKLLKEKPRDDKTLGMCLNLLQYFVDGNKLSSQVSTVALKAKDFDPERVLEILVNLFKDRRHRGYVADSSVIDHALLTWLLTITDGAQGKSTRPCYQRACRLLFFLSMEKSNREKILKSHGLEKVLQIMEKFPEDQGVLLESCGTLRILLTEAGQLPEQGMSRAFNVAMSCLVATLRENGELQWRALAVIHALPVSPPDEMKVAEKAVAAAKQHPGFDGIVEWVAKVLYKICKVKDSKVKDWLRSPECKSWLASFRESPANLRKQNKEAERWVAELWRLCK